MAVSATATTETADRARAPEAWRIALFFLPLAICVAASLAYALGTASSRLVDGAEGHIFYEAIRLHAHKPIYVDPHLGTTDDGLPPGRVYALYTPLMALLAALFPNSVMVPCTRIVATLAWYGLLAWLAATAKRSGANPWLAWGASAFVGGAYVLTLYAATGRPDPVAAVLAGLAFARSVRAGRCGPLEGALFALAAWVKPNVFGLAVGTLAIDLVRRRDAKLVARLLPIATAAAVSLVIGGTLMAVSHGAFLQHLTEPIKAQMTLSLAWEQISSRLPFFGIALALAITLALRSRGDRPDQAALAVAGMTVSLVWTFFSLSKFGSATNYWMEPCLGVAVIAASFPFALSRLGARDGWIATALTFFQLIWMGVGSVRSAIEGIHDAPLLSAEVARIRDVCGARPGETVMGDESGIELATDGRLFHAPVQLTPLVKFGRWKEEDFVADVRQPLVTCAVLSSDLLERPLDAVDPDHDLYDPIVRAALIERFRLVEARDGLWIYALRSREGR